MDPVDHQRQEVGPGTRQRAAAHDLREVGPDVVVQAGRPHELGRPERSQQPDVGDFGIAVCVVPRFERHGLPILPVRGFERQDRLALHPQIRAALHAGDGYRQVARRTAVQPHEETAFAVLPHVDVGPADVEQGDGIRHVDRAQHVGGGIPVVVAGLRRHEVDGPRTGEGQAARAVEVARPVGHRKPDRQTAGGRRRQRHPVGRPLIGERRKVDRLVALRHHQRAGGRAVVVSIHHRGGHRIAADRDRRGGRPVVGDGDGQARGLRQNRRGSRRAVVDLRQAAQRHRRHRLRHRQRARGRACVIRIRHRGGHRPAAGGRRCRRRAVIGDVDRQAGGFRQDRHGMRPAAIGLRQIAQEDRGRRLRHRQRARGRAFVVRIRHRGGHRVAAGGNRRGGRPVVGDVDRQAGGLRQDRRGPRRAIIGLRQILQENLGGKLGLWDRGAARDPQGRIAEEVVGRKRVPGEQVARQRPAGAQNGHPERVLALLQDGAVKGLSQIRRRRVERKGRGRPDRHGPALRAPHQQLGQAVHRRGFEVAGETAQGGHDRRMDVGHGVDVRRRQQSLRTQFDGRAMSRVVDDARPRMDSREQRGAGRRERHRVQIDPGGHRIGGLHQVREARDRLREIPGFIGLIVGEDPLVPPGGLRVGLVGLDLRDHRRQLLRRPRREPPDGHVRQLVAAGVGQQFVRRKEPVAGLAQQRRQMVHFVAENPEIVGMPVARQQHHLRGFRPDRLGIAEQLRNRRRRAQAFVQQIAGVLENRHADAQPLAGPVVRQLLRRRRQRARRDHQIVDAIRFRQEPGVGRRRFRIQHRDRRRLDHRKAFVLAGDGPGLGRQLAVFVGDPGREPALLVQRQRPGLRETGGGNRGGFAGADGGRGGAGHERADVFRREAVQHEIAVGRGVGQDSAHGQHVGAVRGHAGGNGQHGGRRVLVVEFDASHRRSVQAEFGAMVRIPRGGLRPALHVHPERPGLAAIPIQIKGKIHEIRGGIGAADDEVPVVVVFRPFEHGIEREQVLFKTDLRGKRRFSVRRPRRAPRHGQALAFRNPVRRLARIPVVGRLSIEHHPPARRVVDQRNRPALRGELQRVEFRQRLHVFDRQAHPVGNGGQAHSIEALLPQRDLQHGRRFRTLRGDIPRRRFDGPRRERRLGRRWRRGEHDGMRAPVEDGPGQFRFFQTIGSRAPFDGFGIRHRVGRAGLVKRGRQQRLVQAGFFARFRIDAVHAKPRRAPPRPRLPDHATFILRPRAAHLRHGGPGGSPDLRRSPGAANGFCDIADRRRTSAGHPRDKNPAPKGPHPMQLSHFPHFSTTRHSPLNIIMFLLSTENIC